MLELNTNQISSESLIEAHNVGLTLHGQTVLQDINLQLQSGQILSLIGPNGADKTTLVRVLLGLQQATSGQVLKASDLQVAYLPQRLSFNASFPITVRRF